MTSLALRPSGHREYLDRDFLLISVVYFQRKVTVVDQNKIGQSVTLDSFTIQKFV
jgi:hypothetical protein